MNRPLNYRLTPRRVPACGCRRLPYQSRRLRLGVKRTRRAYTLLELVVSMSLATLLMTGLASALFLAGRTFDAGGSTAVQQADAAQVLGDILADVNQALSFSRRTANELIFTVPNRDGDDTPDTIQYSWSGTAGDALTFKFNSSPTETLIGDVHQFDLSYLTRTVTGDGSGGGGTPGVVTFESFAEGKRNANGTNVSVSLPAGTMAGNLLIAAVATDGNTSTSLSAPAGWTPITIDRRGSAVTLGVWWKIAVPSEPGSYNFTWSGKQKAYAWVMRMSGHDPVNPINAWSKAGQGNNAAPTSPSVDATVDNAMILRIGAFDDDDINLDDPGLAGHTPITTDESNNGNGSASGGAGYVMQTTAGPSGTSNFTLTANEQSRKVTIAIAPDPGT
jgi:hypothetical protein